MKMNVATRLIILINLPEQGSVVEMISKRNITKKIDFTSEEVETLKFKNEDGKISWANEIDSIDVEFNNDEITLLKNIINQLDKNGNITDSILDFAAEIQNK